MIEVEIPIKTPSVNHLYGHARFGGMYIKPEAKKIRKEIEEILLSQIGTSFEHVNDVMLKVDVEIHENWYTQKGEIKRVDLANREKFLIDSIFEAIGLDDKLIFEHTMKKVQDEKERAIVRISKI